MFEFITTNWPFIILFMASGAVLGFQFGTRVVGAKEDRLRDWFIKYAQDRGDKETARRLVGGHYGPKPPENKQEGQRVYKLKSQRDLVERAARYGKRPKFLNGRHYVTAVDRFGRFMVEFVV